MRLPNILIYVMDCLRADRLGCYGYAEGRTPNLDRLASESLLFEEAYSQDTWTYPSAASMLSSLYPSALDIRSVDDTLAVNAPWLPKTLQDSGYTTACFSANLLVSEVFGFRRGFDLFVDQFSDRDLTSHSLPVVIQSQDKEILERYMDLQDLLLVTSNDLHQAYLRFARDHSASPFFALVWSMDTHDPYFDRSELALGKPERLYYQPEIVAEVDPAKQTEFSRLYDSMIAHNDRTFGELMQGLDELGLYQDTLIVVCSDHGEAFGEHGLMTHSGRPHGVLTHVPLLIKLPHGQEAGKRSSKLAQLNDLYPTIIDYVKLDSTAEEPLQGQSLLDATTSRNAVWSEGKGYISLRTQEWLFMQWHSRKPWRPDRRGLREPLRTTKTTALFNLFEDPHEMHNTWYKHVHRLSGLALEAQRTWRQNRRILQKLEFRQRSAPLESSVEDRLRALGYLG